MDTFKRTARVEPHEELVGIAGARAITGLSEDAINRGIREGWFPRHAGYVRNHRRWPKSSLLDWVTQEMAKPRRHSPNLELSPKRAAAASAAVSSEGAL